MLTACSALAQEHRLRTLVYKPLCSLRDLLQGPRNLIRKRMDKLLDFEALGEKSDLSYEEQEVATAYRTINALLLAELPSFNATALQLLWGALGTFSCLYRDLAADVEQLFASYTNEVGAFRPDLLHVRVPGGGGCGCSFLVSYSPRLRNVTCPRVGWGGAVWEGAVSMPCVVLTLQ